METFHLGRQGMGSGEGAYRTTDCSGVVLGDEAAHRGAKESVLTICVEVECMPRISLTDFVDIVSKSGTPKATKVAQIKNRPDYEPAVDFYKPLREFIVDHHKRALPKFASAEALASIADPKKMTNYPEAIDGYRRWWGNKALEWFDTPVGTFSSHGVDVVVNPELGLVVNGRSYVIKLYFKADPLSKARVDIVTHMMEETLRGSLLGGEIMAVLDVRRAKLISPTVPIPRLTAALNAELAYVAAMWGSV
jgi:hypothetical protein